jgi:hypothetical protein
MTLFVSDQSRCCASGIKRSTSEILCLAAASEVAREVSGGGIPRFEELGDYEYNLLAPQRPESG